LWKKYVEGAYNDPAYDDLIFKDASSGKKVLFTTANPTASLVQQIEASGKIVVVTMWAERNNFDQGEWAFFSPCTEGGSFTSSVYSDPARPCGQHATTNSKIGKHGTSLTVGPSYQLSYASLPFRASGKLGGLTLKKQFERAFTENAKGTLDYLMVGTFNEHIAQPQKNKYLAWVRSMGLEKDSLGTSLWVDMYGDGISRDMEPTVEDGGQMWMLFESCMRVFKTGTATCSDVTELCCKRGSADPKSHWVNVWSLHHGGENGDRLLTTDQHERSVLLKQGWAEVCSAAGGASAFCAWRGGMAPTAAEYRGGPFVMYASSLGGAGASTPCHRCITPKGMHFISGEEDCHGKGKLESTLGFASAHPSTETPRSLRLCERVNTGAFFHSLDSQCDAGSRIVEHLGFVH